MNAEPPESSQVREPSPGMRRRAAEWLALREARGFTPAEHADFANWLAADARHRAAFAEIAAGWARLDALEVYPHSNDAAPDPDLLRGVMPPRRWLRPALSAAAALAVGAALWLSPWRAEPAGPSRPSIAHVAPRVLALRDGSEVELNAGSEVSEHFTPELRRVRLLRGEAHFTVRKDAARPFVVEAGGVALRAIGTAFNVRLEPAGVEVLVTHGRVQVTPPAQGAAPRAERELPVLEVNQRVVVPLQARPPAPVETLAASDINRVLAWQTSRIAFENLPLSEVVARLKSGARSSSSRLTITDPRLAALRISGRVRADDIDGLVEVLEVSFGVVADRRPDGEVVLRLR